MQTATSSNGNGAPPAHTVLSNQARSLQRAKAKVASTPEAHAALAEAQAILRDAAALARKDAAELRAA